MWKFTSFEGFVVFRLSEEKMTVYVDMKSMFSHKISLFCIDNYHFTFYTMCVHVVLLMLNCKIQELKCDLVILWPVVFVLFVVNSGTVEF